MGTHNWVVVNFGLEGNGRRDEFWWCVWMAFGGAAESWNRCVGEASGGGQLEWKWMGEPGEGVQMGRAKVWFGRKRPVGRGMVVWLCQAWWNFDEWRKGGTAA